jgi:hypothetical protein
MNQLEIVYIMPEANPGESATPPRSQAAALASISKLEECVTQYDILKRIVRQIHPIDLWHLASPQPPPGTPSETPAQDGLISLVEPHATDTALGNGTKADNTTSCLLDIDLRRGTLCEAPRVHLEARSHVLAADSTPVTNAARTSAMEPGYLGPTPVGGCRPG